MPAAARPYWTGFLKLSPVTISVRLYAAATEKERIHFHMIHESSGERVRTQTVVPGLGTAERAEIVKGFEYEKGRYVTIAPQDLEKLRFETTDTIDTTEFVEADGLDPVYVADPYYLVPDGSLAVEGAESARTTQRSTASKQRSTAPSRGSKSRTQPSLLLPVEGGRAKTARSTTAAAATPAKR